MKKKKEKEKEKKKQTRKQKRKKKEKKKKGKDEKGYAVCSGGRWKRSLAGEGWRGTHRAPQIDIGPDEWATLNCF